MFDYIIVGAGSAGCVLAHRLSEDPANKVLLIEAGKTDKKREIHIPAAFSKLFKTEYDWTYHTLPQPAADNREMYLPRGKVLGGSSSINAMIYIRGHRADYDLWADRGNKGWGYDDLLPYFIRSEDQIRGADAFHGTGGPQPVVDPQEPHPISQSLITAAEEAGFSANPDFNGAKQDGFGLYQLIQRNGKRVSAAKAFLDPIKNRPNLRILTEVEVLSLEMEGRRVKGVQARLDTHIQIYTASQAVILSAGAYNSPQLLLRSGIGPGTELQTLEKRVKHHLPAVGKHLQDHLIVPMVFDNKDSRTLEKAESPAALINYLIWAEGPLSSNVAEAGGFVRTLPDLPAPDIQFHFAPGYFMRHGFDLPSRGTGFSLGPTLLQPKSRGQITLNPDDISGAPLIDHAYLEATEDVEALVRGMQIGYQIVHQPALLQYLKGYHLPDRRLHDEAEMAAHVRAEAQTLYHPVGTCRMGPDEMAVVDDRLRVKGLQGLYVVDASVMPEIVRGNTHAPVMALAEKAADLIREDQNLRTTAKQSIKLVSHSQN